VPTTATPTKSVARKFITATAADFWTSVGIFEEALRRKADIDELLADVRRQLATLGPANLRLLCEQASVPRALKAGSFDMVNALLVEADDNTLIHLREFLRRRTEAIEEVFDATFTETQRNGLEGDLNNLCDSGRNETLKPLTKLLLLYRKEPDRLFDAFYLQLWRSRTTYLEFEADKKFPKRVADTLVASSSRLLKLIKAALSKDGVRLLGIHPLPDDTVVVVLHREFSPTIKRDFREEYNVHFGCGIIVFGVNADHDRLVVKVVRL
jgi:hypothetical protein